MLKVSKANTKLKNLMKVKSLKNFLLINKKVYSLDLISGWSCPHAKICLSKVHIVKEKVSIKGQLAKVWKLVRRIKDGPDTQFRCFSASQEALYTKTYDARMFNYTYLRETITIAKHNNANPAKDMARLINNSLPKNAGIVRIHVAGDFFNEAYLKAWIRVANLRPAVLFYAYTKSLIFWIRNKDEIDSLDNFVLTASYGGTHDHLIQEHNLRFVKVVFDTKEASDLGLDIDTDDSSAADPTLKNESFALLIHGVQPKGSIAGKAVKKLKGRGSYGKK